MLALFVMLVILAIIWYIQYYISRRRLYRLASQYNGPKPLPLIGNILYALTPVTDIFQGILAGCVHYKSPARLWIGQHLTIAIWDPENAKIVLNSSDALTKPPQLYSILELMLGSGLVTLPVGVWKRHRKLIAPAFKKKYLKGFFHVILKHATELVERVEAEVNQGVFDVDDNLSNFTANTMIDTMLDLTDARENSDNPFNLVETFKRIMNAMMMKMTKIWYFFDFVFNLSAIGKQMRKDKQSYDNYIACLIKRWEENTFRNRSIRTPDSNRPFKLMDHLYTASDRRGKLTAEELHGEFNTIFSAGAETTAIALGYAMIVLAIHQDIQEQVFQEIIQVKGSKTQLEFEDLKNLKLLERVIKETLRIFSPTVGLARYTKKEIQLTNHVIPANSTIIISSVGLHYDPNIWPNPNKFEPDRFLPEEEFKRHPYCWIPFSAGPRNCLGVRLAILILKTAVARFIVSYKLKTNYRSVQDVCMTMLVVLKPTNGFKICIEPR